MKNEKFEKKEDKMNIMINRVIKVVLVFYIIFMPLLLIAYGACFFIDKFSADMIKSITTLDNGYIIKLTNFEFKFPVLFGYLDLIVGGFLIPQIFIIISAFIYFRFMNGKYSYSLSIEKLQFIKKLILSAYILSSITITTNKWSLSLTENIWLLLVLFLLQKDIIIVKNMHEKSLEEIIKREKEEVEYEKRENL